MAMCVGYFGGGTSREEPTTFSVAGFLSSKARWREFEARWSRMLRHEGLTAFNADDFLNDTGEFANGWNDHARRRGLIEALGRLAEQHIFRAFSESVNLVDYEAINSEYAFSEAAGGPYAVCAARVMVSARQWMATKHPDDLTLFIFEQGDIEQRELRRMLKAAGAEAGEPPQMWPRQWRDERARQRYLRPLEACELFAADRDGVFVRRLTERSVFESQAIDRQQLERICHTLEIAHRSELQSVGNRTTPA